MHNLVLSPISTDTLIESIAKQTAEIVEKKIKDLDSERNAHRTEEYISLDEAAKRLRVDKSTLHNWRKRGVIKGYQLGYRVYLKWSEVEASMVPLK